MPSLLDPIPARASLLDDPAPLDLSNGLVHRWSATLGPDDVGAVIATDLAGSSNWTFRDDMEIIADTEEFNGTRSYQTSGDGYADLVYQQTDQRSISLWFTRDRTSGNLYLFSFDPGTTANSRFRGHTAGSSNGPNTIVGDPGTGIVNPDGRTNFAYHHMVVTVDADTGAVLLYFNGQEVNDAIRSVGSYLVNPATVHARYDASSPLIGRTDTWRVYNRVLTPAEVLQLYNAGRNEDGLGGGTAPENTAPPVVTGDTEVGNQLTTTTGTHTGDPTPTVTLKWQRGDAADGSDAADISGATGAVYTTTDPADVGKYIRSMATATNSEGSVSTPSATVGPITAPPVAAANQFTFQPF